MNQILGSYLQLRAFDVTTNKVSGKIPATIGLLTGLSMVDLSDNSLSGKIPLEMYNLTNLEVLNIYWNHLSGSIESNIGQLIKLSSLNLVSNTLSGKIPSTVGLLTGLSILGLSRNSLTGQLPLEIYNLMNLKLLTMNANQLNGSIDSNIGQLSQLRFLVVNSNNFSGMIPTTIGLLIALKALEISENCLTGTIPTEIGQFSSLSLFDASVNQLSGQIPFEIGKLSMVMLMFLFDNSLTNTLPVELFQCGNLALLALDNNCISGSIPSQIIQLTALKFLSLSSNNLRNGIPSSLFQMITVTYLDLSFNRLTGSISASISRMSYLVQLNVQHNKLGGTIPSAITKLASLGTCILASNAFVGSLDAFVSNISTQQLVGLDVSNNGFSGIIPDALYDNTVLITLEIGSNCFSGSISTAICNAKSLQILDMTEMAGGSGCGNKAKHIIGSIYFNHVANFIEGSIPECLFTMLNLSTLYLSGNGIVSELYDIPVNSKLQAVRLSYNRLYGTIPLSIQTASYLQLLDLSFNFLSGNVENMNNYVLSSTDSTCTLNLESNRLSGLLPKSFADAVSIDVLEGNIFYCDSSNVLPHNDPYYNNYICGSDTLNSYMYFNAVLLLLLVLGGIYAVKQGSSGVGFSALFAVGWQYVVWHADCKALNDNIQNLARILSRFRLYCCIVTIYIVIILQSTYVIMKYKFNSATYEFQYGWALSLCFMSGYGNAVVLALMLLGLYVVCVWVHSWTLGNLKIGHSIFDFQRPTKVSFSYILANVVVVSIANGLYVIALLSYPFGIQLIATLLLVVFKIIWNSNVVLPVLESLQNSFYVITFVILFNNVVLPILVPLFVDVVCFQTFLNLQIL